MLTGITFSTLALVYLPGTLAMAFLMTTVYFGSLAVIGYTTKMNLLRFWTGFSWQLACFDHH